MTDNDIIASIREGDDQLVSHTYSKYRKPFARWVMKKYHCDEDNAIELYQLAFTTFYDQVMSDKLKFITASLKTYIFGIGKNKFYQQERENRRFDHNIDEMKVHDNGEASQQNHEKENQFIAIEKAMQKLGNPCKSILYLYYYEGRSMDEIAKKLDYKNADTAKNQKCKCMCRLRKMLDNKVKVNDQ
ncbi:RNA polymerase sigma factor (sigma-70 family) [Catalinimonas alkaloidigena]|uniref:RNA polymerase sigma factor n=1 Tax=Catalinimonas alkaloidigena TaxID=1075417 RepID=UPI00240746C1|nr:sigma-70 family RNA polymerase sigma factor [Catalinimonas alkaloidigena]MDF9797963.1 RNA polymerase sigma factor (sigma-70 family) [Catalinimonas alkaloidigena]